MSTSHHWSWRHSVVAGACLAALILSPLPTPAHPGNGDDKKDDKPKTETQVKHLIVLIGENRTFDHLFATYVSPSGDHVQNLLSEGIINADGTPGKHVGKAAQFQATPPFRTKYFISLDDNEKAPYATLPEPTLNFSPTLNTTILGFATEPPPYPPTTSKATLAAIEPSLEAGDLGLLTTGASGQDNTFVIPDPDTRVANFSSLPNGPFPLRGATLPYDSYTGDTTHRLFEMCSSPIAASRMPSSRTLRAA